MTHAINLHDATGTIAQTPGVGINIQTGSTVPTNGTAGYAPGAVFIKQTSTGTVLYVNTGTVAACTFVAEQNEDSDFPLDGLTIAGIKVSAYKQQVCNMVLNSAVVSQQFFTADRAYQVVSVTEIHNTLGTNGSAVNLLLEKLTGTTAPGSGTGLQTDNTNAGFDLKATINTLQTGTLTGTTANLQLAAGDRLSLKVGGTATAVAGVTVVVTLKPI